MKIAERMTPNPTSISPRDTLAAARALMNAEGIRHLPIVEAGYLIGMLTEREIRPHAGFLDSTRVNAAMVADPVAIAPSARVADAATLMLERKVRALPVVADGRLVGIITTTDILRAFLDLSRLWQAPHLRS